MQEKLKGVLAQRDGQHKGAPVEHDGAGRRTDEEVSAPPA